LISSSIPRLLTEQTEREAAATKGKERGNELLERMDCSCPPGIGIGAGGMLVRRCSWSRVVEWEAGGGVKGSEKVEVEEKSDFALSRWCRKEEEQTEKVKI
jgi:hypothetical protein